MAAEQEVILLTLPPNTTHIVQLLYKGTFGPLKLAWRHVCHKLYTENPGKVVSIYDISSLFLEEWFSLMTLKNVMTSFRVMSIYPLNRYAVKCSVSKE